MVKLATLYMLNATLLVCALGCGSDAPQIAPVTGTVTRNNQPVPGATVTFQPTKGRTSIGYTNDDGSYELQFTHSLDGACVGKHKVMITFENRPMTPEAEKALVLGMPLPRHPEQDAISKKYGPGKTPLEVDVGPSDNVIDLKLD